MTPDELRDLEHGGYPALRKLVIDLADRISALEWRLGRLAARVYSNQPADKPSINDRLFWEREE